MKRKIIMGNGISSKKKKKYGRSKREEWSRNEAVVLVEKVA
jgi:hypothetical protein